MGVGAGGILRPGERLGDRYRLESRLGAGGMGEVWRAVDELLGRVVAVKVMLPSVADDPEFGRRFLIEATSMARVNHPAVASIHDFGRGRGVTYLVMEFVDGESLAQRLARTGRLDPATTMRIVAQAADGLQAVHDQGIVHRDVKPANLLIRRDGSVVITDFGIARHEDASHLTATGAVLGTPSYLSPEQVLGQPATPRSDVYSLGLTAYECLAGERPFVGDNPYAVALQRLQSAPRTIGVTLPAPVLRVVERALATDPAGRWPSAAALADAARATATPGAPASPRTPEIAEPGPRRKVIAAAWAAAILVVVVAAAWFITRAGSGDDGRLQAQQPDVRTGGATTATATVKGFAACGNALCPTEPMCWSGLTSISGKAQPPAPVNCSEEHYWETFAAVRLPAGAADGRADELMERPDVAKACSAALMASRSKDPAATRSWRRDAWPIQRTGDGVPLLHCLAGSTDGETTKTIF